MRVRKILLFIVCFFLFSFILAFLFRDDEDAYSRLVMHDLQTQEQIDILFCGASHVSHGILAEMLDERLGKSTCSAGTPNQTIVGTYTIIKTASQLYNLEQVFVDIDYGIATGTQNFRKKRYSESDFLVAHYLKNPLLKIEYTLTSISPKYYLNAFYPLGFSKLLSLNPVTVYKNLWKKINGQYYKYTIDDGERKYNKKGCIFEFEQIKNGTFSSKIESPISTEISPDYKKYILKIAKLCEENNIKLTFCAYPVSDFLLASKGNYDEFYFAMKSFLNENGYDFCDFNLINKNYLDFIDEDFNDDNHLNDIGIKKFTMAVAKYITDSPSDFFYKSYSEKLNNQSPRILGVMTEESDDKASVKYIPVLNNGKKENITWKICVEENGNETTLEEHTTDNSFIFPNNRTGNLKIYGYYDGQEQTCTTIFFNTK